MLIFAFRKDLRRPLMDSADFSAGLESRRRVAATCAGLTACAALIVLASSCAPRPQRPPQPEPVVRVTPTPTQRAVPTPTPTRVLQESSIGEGAVLTPAPSAAGSTADNEPEPLLARISTSTPPNVAAALRLIEDSRQQIRQGAYDAALDRLERAVAIDPTNVYGYYFLAQVHFFKKNYDQAVAFASRAASLGRRADAVSQGRIYGLQGAVFEQVGRYPDARRAYREALTADPNNAAARVGLSRLGDEY